MEASGSAHGFQIVPSAPLALASRAMAPGTSRPIGLLTECPRHRTFSRGLLPALLWTIQQMITMDIKDQMLTLASIRLVTLLEGGRVPLPLYR
ncbi:UNVERIFIED_CONTAM: hypothetical protein Sradi_1318300 [Sesamum radiatum]|uniref:Uncharacterized protein n=1 Tax=Sesamum radiatum TaxID=300843 RepID=A0AAW2UQ66_SESRA